MADTTSRQALWAHIDLVAAASASGVEEFPFRWVVIDTDDLGDEEAEEFAGGFTDLYEEDPDAWVAGADALLAREGFTRHGEWTGDDVRQQALVSRA